MMCTTLCSRCFGIMLWFSPRRIWPLGRNINVHAWLIIEFPVLPEIPKAVCEGLGAGVLQGSLEGKISAGWGSWRRLCRCELLVFWGTAGAKTQTEAGETSRFVGSLGGAAYTSLSTWRLWKDLGLWVLKSLVGNGEQGACSWSVWVSWVEDQEALVKAFAPAVLLLGVYPREMKAYVHIKTCVSTCMAALFITPQNWKWPSCPSMREWLSKLWVHSHHRRLLVS